MLAIFPILARLTWLHLLINIQSTAEESMNAANISSIHAVFVGASSQTQSLLSSFWILKNGI